MQILLDSNFEIALKEFIVNRMDLFPPHIYNDAKIVALFKARHLVINEVKAHVNLSKTLLGKVWHYYNLRNKLVHERATVGITDSLVLSRQLGRTSNISTLCPLIRNARSTSARICGGGRRRSMKSATSFPHLLVSNSLRVGTRWQRTSTQASLPNPRCSRTMRSLRRALEL